MAIRLEKNDFIACCGSTQFAEQMVLDGPFATYDEVVVAAKNVWFNKVDVHGWLEAYAAHPQIGQNPSSAAHKSSTSAQWSKGEQSTALATATDSSLQELYDWNSKYKQKFGFVFLICASGRSTPEILSELKRRFSNRPIVEFENAAQEQMKITELRLRKLFSNIEASASTQVQSTATGVTKAEGRVIILGGHLTPQSISSDPNPPPTPTRVRPPITTHVLDVARGCPAAGIEVQLEMYNAKQLGPMSGNENWVFHGSSTTDKDGRSGQLMKVVDDLSPGIYRISFNTGKYNPNGFFPFVSIVFEGQLGIIQILSPVFKFVRFYWAIREKISDIRGSPRKVKYDAKYEEQQAELARAQLDEIAHQARLIRQAEAAMGLHIEEYIHHGTKLTGDHKNTTGYGGNGLNNRHVNDHGGYGGGGAAARYTGGSYSGVHDSRKMAIHHKYL